MLRIFISSNLMERPKYHKKKEKFYQYNLSTEKNFKKEKFASKFNRCLFSSLHGRFPGNVMRVISHLKF